MDSLNIPVTGWSKTFLDLSVNSIYWMYTCLTGTQERWINNHRSITEIERDMEPAAGDFFFLNQKIHEKIDHNIHWTAANIQNRSLDLKLKVLLNHDTFYILLVIHLLNHQIIFHLWFFPFFLSSLKRSSMLNGGVGVDVVYCSK